MMKIKITDLTIKDIRFPASSVAGAISAIDANTNYSAAYVTIHTNDPKLKGYGLTFTIGHTNESCVTAIHALKTLVIGQDLVVLTEHMGEFWRQITDDSRLRHLGFDKTINQLATAAIINAVWDLWARRAKKPLWRLIVDMSPAEVIRCLDFSHITDVITPDEALDILRNNAMTKAKRMVHLLEKGYPAHAISSTYPNDVLGHAKIRETMEPIKIATDEHNRAMFKQLLQKDAIDFCQIHSCRLGGVNEILIVLLMAAKFKVPVSPHAGGLGLSEYVQHLAIIDYIYISGSLENRVLDYVDHFHEHFESPVIVKDGYYQVPTKPGYSIEMKESSLKQYNYPNGLAWEFQ